MERSIIMDIKKYFGILGFSLVAALASPIIINCIVVDVKTIGRGIKKIFAKAEQS